MYSRKRGSDKRCNLDILLHQSGHIMLSDFDLAKQSSINGGGTVTIHKSEVNGVRDTFLFNFSSPFAGPYKAAAVGVASIL